MISWREKSKNEKSNLARDSVLDALSQGQRTANTTRSSAPGVHPQVNNVPTPNGLGPRHRSSKAAAVIRTAAAKSDASRRMPARQSKAGLSYAFEEVVDGEDDDRELARTLPSTSRPKRKRVIDADNATENDLRDLGASSFAPGGGSSRSEVLSEDRGQHGEPAANLAPYVVTNHNRERQIEVNSDAHRNKKRRGQGRDKSNELPMDTLWPQNGLSSQANRGHTTEAQRHLRHSQLRNRRLGRQPAQATSSALGIPPAAPFSTQAPYTINDLPGYQIPNGYSSSRMTDNDGTGFVSNMNSARDSSLRGIANELGLARSYYGETLEQAQGMNSNGGYMDPPRRYSDPLAVNPYQNVNDQGSFDDGMGYIQPQSYPPRRATDPLASFSYGNAYGNLGYNEQDGQGQYLASTDSGQIEQSWAHNPYVTNTSNVTTNAAPRVPYAAYSIFQSPPQFSSPVEGSGYVESPEAEVAPQNEQDTLLNSEYHSQVNAFTATDSIGDRQPADETASSTAASYSHPQAEVEAVQHQADAIPSSSDPASLDAEYNEFFNFDEEDVYRNSYVFDKGI